MFRCQECGKEVSENTVQCPHCGYHVMDCPFVTRKKRKKQQMFYLVFSVLFLFLTILTYCWGEWMASTNFTSTVHSDYFILLAICVCLFLLSLVGFIVSCIRVWLHKD